jgi:hypothetical protein
MKMQHKMKVKRLIPICLWAGILVICFTGCKDLLDEEMYSSQSVDNFYKNKQEATLALSGVYNTLWSDTYRDAQWTTLEDVVGGTLKGGGDPNGSGDRSAAKTVWNTYGWSSDAHEVSDIWDVAYDGINNANTLIDGVVKSTMTDEDKKWIDGQAKFLRALFYFNLVRLFGDVPLELSATVGLTDIDKPRSPSADVYAQIISDLTDAEQELSPYNDADHTAGRATSAAATALLAKVYAQQQDWTNAAKKAKEVMDLKVFSLVKDYHAVFSPDNTNNDEMIFTIQHGGTGNTNNGLFSTRMIYLFGPPQETLPNGTTILFHNLQDVVIFQVDKDFFNTSPDTYRKWQTMRDKMPYYFVGNNLVEDTVPLYAPFVIKFDYVDLSNAHLSGGVDFPLIRYSDVLLTYAEAINEVNGGPDQSAYDAVNMVRRRARAVGTAYEQPESVYPDISSLSQEAFRQAVLTEEAREFVGEGHRRDDLLRHNLLIENAKQRGISNADAHHIVFPLPGTAVSVNENLEQNSGY